MIFVEIKKYSYDSDCLFTDSIWVGSGDFIPGNYEDDNNVEKVYKDLKAQGFKPVKTKSVEVGGNL